MEFQQSKAVDPCSYESMGLSLFARNSKHEDLANKACLQAQADWTKYVAPIPGFVGCTGKYNFAAITMPEALPERLGALAYMSEVGLLYDGISTHSPSSSVSILSNTYF